MTLHEMVYNDIIEKVRLGHYKKGDMLPTEKEMENIYDISRAPIRQAINKLSDIGVIERKAGKGTFISDVDALNYRTNYILGGFSEHINQATTCKCIGVKNTKVIPKIAQKLKISLDEEVVNVVRVRYTKKIPVLYMSHYIPNVDHKKIANEGDFFSMRYILIHKFKLKLENIIETITAVLPEKDVQEHLQVTANTPVMKIGRLSLDDQQIPRVYLEYYAKSSLWDYKVFYHKSIDIDNTEDEYHNITKKRKKT